MDIPKLVSYGSISYGSYCCVPWCRNKARTPRKPGTRFFRIPRDNRSTAWLTYAGRDDLLGKPASKLYTGYRVCSDHFTARDYMDPKHTRLTKMAVPTVSPVTQDPVVQSGMTSDAALPQHPVPEGHPEEPAGSCFLMSEDCVVQRERACEGIKEEMSDSSSPLKESLVMQGSLQGTSGRNSPVCKHESTDSRLDMSGGTSTGTECSVMNGCTDSLGKGFLLFKLPKEETGRQFRIQGVRRDQHWQLKKPSEICEPGNINGTLLATDGAAEDVVSLPKTPFEDTVCSISQASSNSTVEHQSNTAPLEQDKPTISPTCLKSSPNSCPSPVKEEPAIHWVPASSYTFYKATEQVLLETINEQKDSIESLKTDLKMSHNHAAELKAELLKSQQSLAETKQLCERLHRENIRLVQELSAARKLVKEVWPPQGETV